MAVSKLLAGAAARCARAYIQTHTLSLSFSRTYIYTGSLDRDRNTMARRERAKATYSLDNIIYGYACVSIKASCTFSLRTREPPRSVIGVCLCVCVCVCVNVGTCARGGVRGVLPESMGGSVSDGIYENFVGD